MFTENVIVAVGDAGQFSQEAKQTGPNSTSAAVGVN